jgi:hypothetical protein
MATGIPDHPSGFRELDLITCSYYRIFAPYLRFALPLLQQIDDLVDLPGGRS